MKELYRRGTGIPNGEFSRTLVFILGNANREDLRTRPNSFFAPLSWGDKLALQSQGVPTESIVTEPQINALKNSPSKAARRLQQFIAQENALGEDSDCVHFIYSVFLINAWIEETVELAIQATQANQIVCPRLTSSTVIRLVGSLDTLLYEVAPLLACESLARACHPYRPMYVGVRPLDISTNFDSMFDAPAGLHPLDYFARKMWNTIKGARGPKPFEEKDSVITCPVLIVSEPSKSSTLEELLNNEEIGYKRLSLTSIADSQHVLSIDLHEGTRDVVLASLLSYYCRVGRASLDSSDIFQRFDAVKVLLTTKEYHPQVRKLIRYFLDTGRSVALLPEGANGRSELTSSWHNFWNVSYPGACRFLTGEAEARYWSRCGCDDVGDLLVTGYLGGQRQIPAMVAHGIENTLKFLTSRKKYRIFVSFDALDGLTRPENFAEFEAITRLLDALRRTEFQIICKLRHSSQLSAIKRQYPQVSFFQYIPWNVLANACDVVVHQSSSVGIESLSRGKPVIIWRPFNVVRHSNAYAQQQSDVLRVARDENELVRCLSDLNLSATADFRPYEYFLAREHQEALRWIKDRIS